MESPGELATETAATDRLTGRGPEARKTLP